VPSRATLSKLKATESATVAMSNSDISSWVTSSSSLGPDEDSDHQNEWQKDRVLSHWPAAMEFAQRVLLKDRTKVRIAFLRNDILPLAKHAGDDVFDSLAC
jgi:hypothetical protein